MKISIVTGPWLPVPAIQGGAMNRIWQGIAEKFALQGHDVTIICRAFRGQPETEQINGVHYIRRSGFPQSPRIIFDIIKDLIYSLQILPELPQSDVLIINDFWLPLFAPLRPETGRVIINSNRYPKGQYFLYQKASLIVASSHAVSEAIIQQSPYLKSKICVIPNPIHPIFSRNSIANKQEKESFQKLILYVGRLHPEKGIHLLIQAFRLLTQKNIDVKLQIVGPYLEEQGGGGTKYLQRLQALATGLPIVFEPPVFEVNKLVEIYSGADIFCYPSLAEHGESFGLAPLEAMAMGLVTIVSRLNCFRDFIVDGQTGYTFNHNSSDSASELALILERTIKNWNQTSGIREEAMAISERFSYEEIAKSYLSRF